MPPHPRSTANLQLCEPETRVHEVVDFGFEGCGIGGCCLITNGVHTD